MPLLHALHPELHCQRHLTFELLDVIEKGVNGPDQGLKLLIIPLDPLALVECCLVVADFLLHLLAGQFVPFTIHPLLLVILPVTRGQPHGLLHVKLAGDCLDFIGGHVQAEERLLFVLVECFALSNHK